MSAGCYIGGSWQPGTATFPVFNPADGSLVAEAAEDDLCSVEVPLEDLVEDAAPDLVQTQPSKPVGRVALQGLTVSRVVGLDFGTSATRMAYAVGERIAVVMDEMGRTWPPNLSSSPSAHSDHGQRRAGSRNTGHACRWGFGQMPLACAGMSGG